MNYNLNVEFLRVASDTHLEHRGFTFRSNPVKAREVLNQVFPRDDRDSKSVMVLAGDIGSHPHIELIAEVFSKRFPLTIYVPGNHEYYGTSVELLEQTYVDPKYNTDTFMVTRPSNGSSGVIVDLVTPFGKFKILACTLWAAGDKTEGPVFRSLMSGMSDFRTIQYQGRFFTPKDMAAFNERDSLWLEDNLSHQTQNIVVTHHMPSFLLIDDKYKGSLSNYGFASDQSRLFKDVSLWIYGHTHHQKDELLFPFKNPRFLSNALGYPRENCSYGFNPTLFFPLAALKTTST